MGKKKNKKANEQPAASSSKLYVGVGSVLILVIAAIFAIVYIQQPDEVQSLTGSSDKENSLVHVKGNPDAVNRLAVYSDFGCIHCARLHPHLIRLAEEHGDEVAIEFHHYPINNNMPSRKAIAAVLSADKQGKYEEMSDLIYQTTDQWRVNPDEALKALASDIGLNMEQFERDYHSDDLMYNIVREYYESREKGIQSTPSLFLNGDRVGNPGTYEGLVQVVL